MRHVVESVQLDLAVLHGSNERERLAMELARALEIATTLIREAEVRRGRPPQIRHARRAGERDRGRVRLTSLLPRVSRGRHVPEIIKAARLATRVADPIKDFEGTTVVVLCILRLLALYPRGQPVERLREQHLVTNRLGLLHAESGDAGRLADIAKAAIRLRQHEENVDALPLESQALRIGIEREKCLERQLCRLTELLPGALPHAAQR